MPKVNARSVVLQASGGGGGVGEGHGQLAQHRDAFFGSPLFSAPDIIYR